MIFRGCSGKIPWRRRRRRREKEKEKEEKRKKEKKKILILSTCDDSDTKSHFEGKYQSARVLFFSLK